MKTGTLAVLIFSLSLRPFPLHILALLPTCQIMHPCSRCLTDKSKEVIPLWIPELPYVCTTGTNNFNLSPPGVDSFSFLLFRPWWEWVTECLLSAIVQFLTCTKNGSDVVALQIDRMPSSLEGYADVCDKKCPLNGRVVYYFSNWRKQEQPWGSFQHRSHNDNESYPVEPNSPSPLPLCKVLQEYNYNKVKINQPLPETAV